MKYRCVVAMSGLTAGAVVGLASATVSSAMEQAETRTLSAEQQAIRAVTQEVTPPSATPDALDVVMWVDRPDYTYAVGEDLRLFVQTNKTAYVTVLNVDPAGNTSVLFPNEHQSSNLVPADRAVEIPDPASGMMLTVRAPVGNELIKVIASTQPVSLLDGEPLNATGPFVGLDAQAGASRSLAFAIDEAVKTSDDSIEWAVCHQTITTLAASREGNLQALQVPRTRDSAWSATCEDARMAGRQRVRRSVGGPVTREAVAGVLRSLVPVAVDNSRELREVSVMLQIRFDLNSAELSPQAMRELDQVAAALIDAEMVDVPVTIEGHADATGAEGYNRRLSQARADAALAYLISRGGVAGERLQAIGYGSDRLLQEWSPTDARQRRVEIVFTF